jgi:hypothetical protein
MHHLINRKTIIVNKIAEKIMQIIRVLPRYTSETMRPCLSQIIFSVPWATHQSWYSAAVKKIQPVLFPGILPMTRYTIEKELLENSYSVPLLSIVSLTS